MSRLRHTLIAELLRGRRAQLQPEDVGIPRDSRRRVPGLRREEVAARAGINRDYYIRLEQAHGHLPSPQVVSSLARALELEPDTIEHLQRLAQPEPVRRLSTRQTLPPWAFDALTLVEPRSAFLSTEVHDVLAVSDGGEGPGRGLLAEGRNLLIEVFENRATAPDEGLWRETATRLVDALRFHAAPDDERFRDVLRTLHAGFPAFREIWGRQRARKLMVGRSLFPDPDGGWRLCEWQTLVVPDHPGCILTVFLAEGRLSDPAREDAAA
jgi:transcriptional regulator with XRE-family HTH domain